MVDWPDAENLELDWVLDSSIWDTGHWIQDPNRGSQVLHSSAGCASCWMHHTGYWCRRCFRALQKLLTPADLLYGQRGWEWERYVGGSGTSQWVDCLTFIEMLLLTQI